MDWLEIPPSFSIVWHVISEEKVRWLQTATLLLLDIVAKGSYDKSSSIKMDFYTSTPKNEKLQGSRDSSSEESYFDDDDDKRGPNSDEDSFTNITSQLDFGDNSSFAESNSFQEMSASRAWRDDQADFSANEDSWNEDDRSSNVTQEFAKKTTSVRNSKNYCYVCGKGMSKIARHLLTHADKEPAIAEAFALPVSSKERKRLLDELRNKGNYKHNQNVLRKKTGKLKLRRQTANAAVSAKTHTHCLYCKGMYKRKELWRHTARCPSNTAKSAASNSGRVLNEIALAESPFSEKLTSGVRELLLSLKADEVALAVQNDYLLIQLAKCLCEEYADNPNKYDYIRQKLREMGRLLLALRERSIFTFEEAIKPENFSKVAESVSALAGFNKKITCHKKTGLSSSIMHSFKAIVTIVLAEAHGNEQIMKDTKKFMKLCENQWMGPVPQKAHTSRSKRKAPNPATIPFTHDVQLFYKYLETSSADASESLKLYEIAQVYNALCKVTVAQVAVLNKCAPEVSKMKLRSFQERADTTKVLSKNFIRINTLSRSGHNIAILLTSELVSAITLLVSKRDACGVHGDNPFLFAKAHPSATAIFHGRSCINSFISVCRAKNPEHLRALHLNKHIARVFQILNLENDELHHLSKLLGHDIRADRDYYRLPEAAVELAKIAKLLLAMEKGSLERFKGNSLEEIEIEDELESDVEQENPDDANAEEEDNEESVGLPPQSVAVEQTLTPKQDALEHIKACRDKPSLEERFIDPDKGRGVFTHESIAPATFVVEYRGKVFPHEETRKNKCSDTLTSYLLDFSWNGSNWRIDASKEDGTLGRLVNDDHLSPNCKMKKIIFEGKPHLCLFAVKEISPGEEITYDYGDSPYPWRSNEAVEELPQTEIKAAGSSQKDEKVEDSAACGSAKSCISEEFCSEEEYIPEFEPCSDGSFTSSHNNPDFAESGCSKQLSFAQQPTITDDCPDESSSDDESTHGDPPSGNPSCTNRNFCYVCGEAKTKISRHLFTHRNEEPDIAKAFASRRKSKERKRLLEELRNRGNYKHNMEVLKTRCGQLKVRRKANNTNKNAFAMCLHCKGLFVRKAMWIHLQKCPSNKFPTTPPGNRVRTKISAMVAFSEAIELSSDLCSIIDKMKKDEVTSAIHSDSHILQLGQYMLLVMENKPRKKVYIQQKLREMGRLLLTLRKKSIITIEEAIKSRNFSKLVEAVREIAGFNEAKSSCPRPSLLIKLGMSLKKIGEINFARAVKEDADKETIHEAGTFIKLCAEEWRSFPQSKPQVISLSTIPFTQDVQLFYHCMKETTSSAVESLTFSDCPPVYNALLRVVVAQVFVLNKCASRISKVTLKSFKERDESELGEDAAGCQSQFEQILSKHFLKINVMTNGGRKLPLTLTPELLSAITLLVNKRESCGVHEGNPFLFGRPTASCMNYYHGYQCARTMAIRCGAKKPETLKSVFFHKHMRRVFEILSLTNDELDQLAKLLGCDIRLDRLYYQTPEAAVDIAKISVLLSAMEYGSLEKFQGKSLEEIEIADELEPDMELGNSENSDAEEDNEELESSLQLSGLSKCSFPSTRKSKRISSSRKRSLRESTGSESETCEVNDEKSDEDTEKDHRPEDMPTSRAAATREETPSGGNADVSNICFSDDDEDMNVDYDMDFDTDEDAVRNEESDGDGDTNSPAATPGKTDVKATPERHELSSDEGEKDASPNKHLSDMTMDTDALTQEEEENQMKGQEENNSMDLNHRKSSAILTEKEKRLLAAMTGMKEVKIVISKLDIEKLKAPVHISKLPSLCNSIKWPVNDPPVHDPKNKSSNAEEMRMICSHCKKSMMKGQTAYQKKGFTEVFCTKRCLFEMFPIVKPVTKTCYYCLKVISQLLDLILAAVDIRGTMKDFCSVTCLSSFKSNLLTTQTSQSICSRCSKSCSSTCELTLDGAVHKFCSATCMEVFHKDNTGVCETCGLCCRKTRLILKMDEGNKIICSDKCLDKFIEKIKTPHRCTMCHVPQLPTDMICYKSGMDMLELFCTQNCVTSYKLQPAMANKLQGNKPDLRSWKRGNTEEKDVQVGSDSTANQASASTAVEMKSTPIIVTADYVICCHCGKKLPRGQTLYQSRRSQEVFCSESCLSLRHPHIELVTKNCYNCCQAIMRPHNIILAPVDDSGTKKELCSETCLASVKSKMKTAVPKLPPPEGPQIECRMCARLSLCKYKLNRICSDTCFINYHKVNNLPLVTCDVCGSLNPNKNLVLRMEDVDKTICSDECLVKFKEKSETPQLCIMCQTSHQMSDMVENKNDEGKLDFFCSNRCMTVYKAQMFTVSERKNPLSDEIDVKEVKPLIPNLDFIKEEPIDEEYNQNLPASISAADIKDEPNISKVDLKIGSVFSLTSESTPAAPTFTHMDLPASCSFCKNVLMDGETVYQKKGCADIFCSTSCLLQFYQMKPVKKTCHFCLQVITQPQDILQAPVDSQETMTDFCSQTCLSSFSYMRLLSTKTPLVPITSQSQCCMCGRYCISKHEIRQHGTIHKICSEPCFRRFSNLSVCKNCSTQCNSLLTLEMGDSSETFCGAECLAQFKREIKTPQPCSMCHTSRLMSDMVENKTSEDVVKLFCTSSCLMASKIQAVSASGAALNCDNCGKMTVPACHLAMSDASVTHFCSLTCAMAFKDTQKDTNVGTNPTGASDQTQCGSLKPPKKLLCAHCSRVIKTVPKVIQKEAKMYFVCTLACSQQFKRMNNVVGECEWCKKKKIIEDTKSLDNRDCYFCCEGCKIVFEHTLEKKWGKHCRSCAYCLSISKTLVTAQYEKKTMEFCSEECNSKYEMLQCCAASCDTCGCKKKLKKSLPMPGEVKHFCNLKCLLLLCIKKGQTVNTGSSAPGPAGAVRSSPVIANVISLASVLKTQHSVSTSTTQHDSVSDIQTKVVGHVSIQTVPKELKNKSMLCAPLVHNKGVACATQTVDVEAQTDNNDPKVTVLPVPVYVPVPMNLYSQYTPIPVGLPLPLPVPMFLPVTSDKTKSVTQSVERIPPDHLESELSFHPETEEKLNKNKEKEEEENYRESQVTQAPEVAIHQTPHQAPPPLAVKMTEDDQSSLSPLPAPSLLQQTVDKEHNNKARKLKQPSKAHKEETPQRHVSKAASAKRHKLVSQYGIDAWKRWKESQTDPERSSPHSAALPKDVLRCSSAELKDGLCRFITEVKRPDGKPYSPSSLFYLCLSIQQYLFENGRMENIFSDVIYREFWTVFNKVLERFTPSFRTSGPIHFCVEEGFLWDCKQLGAYSPIVLLNTLLFFSYKYFGFTTVEQHRRLSFASVKRGTKTNEDNTKTNFLCFNLPVTNSKPEPDSTPAKKRRRNMREEEVLELMENTENPLRCPVRLYQFYLCKSSESVRCRSDVFYLQPDHCCVPTSPLWFFPTPLDDRTMGDMLLRILTVRVEWWKDASDDDQQASDSE